MGDPNYVYTPWPAERRAKLRESLRKRLGNRKGHRRVYGVQVPLEHHAEVRRYAAEVARRRGYNAANGSVRKIKANGWVVPNDLPRLFEGVRPAGHVLMHGVWVPKNEWLKVNRYILQMVWLKKYGPLAARQWLKDAKAAGWRVEMPPLELSVQEKRDWTLFEELLEEGMTIEEIATYLGVKVATFQNSVRKARKEGLSAFGSRLVKPLEWL